MWNRINPLIVKELLTFWRDPKSRAILIVPPLIQLLIFAFAATQEVKNISIAILNLDQGTVSRDVIARFEGSNSFTRIDYLAGEADIAPVLDSGKCLMILHFPSDFSRKVLRGEPTEVQLLLDGRRSNAAQIVAGYTQTIIETFNRNFQETNKSKSFPSLLIDRVWFNPNLEPTWNTVPSLVVIITTIMGLIVTALSVARERELGTFEQLLVSPLSPLEIIFGKSIPALLISLVEVTGMLLVGVYVFHIPFQGSLLLLYCSMFVYLGSVIGIGLFISSLARTQQQAILGAFSFMVPAILLSGFASPIQNMPNWLQVITLANPVRHYLIIVKGLFLKNMPTNEVIENLWPLCIIGMVTLAGATLLFRRRLS